MCALVINAECWPKWDKQVEICSDDNRAEGIEEELMRDMADPVTLKTLRHTRLLGMGAFGSSIRLVENIRTGEHFALKRIRRESAQARSCVQTEVDVLRAIDHPFAMQVISTFESKDSFYLMLELVTGGSLSDAMLQLSPMQQEQAQFYLGSLVSVLEAVHQHRIVYRDLKPRNVLLDNAGYIKLIDFGLAKPMGNTDRTYTVTGTLRYMAPEVLLGDGYGYPADVWSLGVLFYELVCGKAPFSHVQCTQEQDIVGEILQGDLVFPDTYTDEAGRRLISSMLCRDPAQRIGLEGWDEVKCHDFFCTNNAGEFFERLVTRGIDPPLVPQQRDFKHDFGVVSAVLDDGDEFGGEAEYVLDSRWLRRQLKQESKGLSLRHNKDWGEEATLARKTASPVRKHAMVWGTLVQGLEHGDGWLRLANDRGYLPTRVQGIPVMVPHLYLVDNSELKASTMALCYRMSKCLEDLDEDIATAHPRWGTLVGGVDEGDGWLRIADRYLPMELEGVRVLKGTLADQVIRPSRHDDKPLRFSSSGSSSLLSKGDLLGKIS